MVNASTSPTLNPVCDSIELKQGFGQLVREIDGKDSGQFKPIRRPEPVGEATLKLTFGARDWWHYKELAELAARNGNYSQAEAMWLAALIECNNSPDVDIEDHERLAVTLDNLACGFVEVLATSRIPKTAPQAQQVGERCGCTCTRRRILLHEVRPLRDHPCNLSLLSHHFAHEDRPAVACGAPRQVAQPRFSPDKQWFDDVQWRFDCHRGSCRGHSAQTSWPSYGRSRLGADARFHTITRRRK